MMAVKPPFISHFVTIQPISADFEKLISALIAVL